ncbi:MAG TPA: fluoride efflux transporter CrcB [Anaerolineales bacterium]|nr:fluoride efflux transporter CrcB [Anaerolineales bacterium]
MLKVRETGWYSLVHKAARRLFSEAQIQSMQTFILISLGAILGANLRYWVGGWAANSFGTVFPYGTLIINVSGSLILGFFITLVTDRFLADPRWRVLVAIGFLGAYTTFSTYTYESVTMILKGQLWLGLLDLFGSSLLGAAAVLAGILLGRVV